MTTMNLESTELYDLVKPHINSTFETYAKAMPNSEYYDNVTDTYKTCDALVLLASHDVCPIVLNKSVTNMQPLQIRNSLVSDTENGRVVITNYTIGYSTETKATVKDTVDSYNATVKKFAKISPLALKHIIIATYIFDN